MKALLVGLLFIPSLSLAWRGSIDYGASKDCKSDHITFESMLGVQIIGFGYAHNKCINTNPAESNMYDDGKGVMLYFPKELEFARPRLFKDDRYFISFNLEYTTIAPRWGAEIGYTSGMYKEGFSLGTRLMTEGENIWDMSIFLRLQFGSLKKPRGNNAFENISY